MVSPFFLVLPAFGVVLITYPSSTSSLFFCSVVYVKPALVSFSIASSVVEPTTLGTVTSFTSRVVINQKTAPVISSNKKKIAKIVIKVFFLLGSSKNSSSSSSSFSISSGFISLTNSSVSSAAFSFSGLVIFFFDVTVGIGTV